jgi:diguanylate cyclase (GGDEF)-like protein/PAS domain S-box-containing protein
MWNARFEDWIGKTDAELWPPDVAKSLRLNDLSILDSGESRELLEQAPLPNGETRHFLSVKFPFQTEPGQMMLGGVSIDITSRRQAEEALQVSEAFNRSILENTVDLIETLDRAGHLLSSNFRLPIIRSIGELWAPTWQERFAEDVAKALDCALQGRSMEFQATLRADPTRWFSVFVSPINDPKSNSIDCILVVARDITVLKESEYRLQQSEFRYRSVVEHAGDIIYQTDHQGRFTFYNEAARRVLLIRGGEVLGKLFTDLIHPSDRANALRFYSRQRLSGTQETYYEFRCIAGDGEIHWLGQNVQLLLNEEGKVEGFQAIARDITERRKAQEALARQAAEDSLTGLANRTVFTQRLTRCVEQNYRDPSYIFGVLFLDLDHFKVINDSLGHVAGDQLLVEIAHRLSQTVRSSDLVARLSQPSTVARLGGDEFAVLIENAQSMENARRIADRIQRDMNQPFTLENHSVFTTFSIGVALSNGNYLSAEEILRDADIAMYAAKTSGKARVAVFDPAMRARAIARLEIESDLRRALASGELILHYQPEVDLRSGEIIGFEALVRWVHPTRGTVPPLEFIPVAEETGLIAPLGAWVLEEACRQIRRWQSAFPKFSKLKISVNLSGKQLTSKDLLGHVEQALQASSLAPDCLDLEITESFLMEDTEAAIQTLLNLKQLGVGLQIDDFGTGYSSLSYLHRLPFDTLKIDRSFVHSLDGQEDGIEIVRTIMALAQSLKMSVIAEGVETRTQLLHLRRMGCGFAQGYHFSKALDTASAETLLSTRSQTGAEPFVPQVSRTTMSAGFPPVHAGIARFTFEQSESSVPQA